MQRPKRTISAALEAAAVRPSHTVLLLPGRYAPTTTGEEFPVHIRIAATLEAADSAGLPVLDAESSAGVIEVDSVSGVALRDLRLTHGLAASGGGLLVLESSLFAEGLRIDSNVATSQGSGVFVSGGELVLAHSVVVANSSAGTADAHGVYVVNAVAELTNNVIGYHDSNGLLITGTAVADVRNNIFFTNGRAGPTPRGRGICEVSSPHRTALRYNLFFGNVRAAVLFGGSGDLTAAQANDVAADDAIAGNLDLDPLFVAPAAFDFRLQPGSPARDAGDPNPAFNDRDGTRNDIGRLGGQRR